MNYKIKKGDINTYINARVRFECDSKIIAMAICLPFIIYFGVIGIIVDDEALIFAYSLLFIFILLLIATLMNYYLIKKNTILSFKQISKNDEIEYKFSKKDDLFELLCLNNDKTFNFKFSDIKIIKKYKKVIILLIDSKNKIVLPNVREIVELFDN